jgi:hypothetical protein
MEESAVPSMDPLTSLPDERVPLRVISTHPQNQPLDNSSVGRGESEQQHDK